MAFNVPTGLSRPEGTSWLAHARGSYLSSRTHVFCATRTTACSRARLVFVISRTCFLRAATVRERLVVPPVQPLAHGRTFVLYGSRRFNSSKKFSRKVR